MKNSRLLFALALLLAVAALAVSLDTFLSIPRRNDLLTRKTQTLRALDALSIRYAPEQAWLAERLRTATTAPLDLAPLAARHFSAGQPLLTPRPPSPAPDGWQRRETLLALSDIPYSALSAFCTEAAQTLPPWRLCELELRPSEKPGIGDATLLFEALEKKPQ